MGVSCPEVAADQVRIFFTVTDTGIGLGDMNRQYLFSAFTQADGSTTRKYGGTGLGLAICKSLVNMMGGEITAETNNDGGSTFRFWCRFSRQGEAGDPVRQLPWGFDKNRALVVSNSRPWRGELKYQAESFGLVVNAVSSVRLALELLQKDIEKDPCHLVIIDRDGLEENGAGLYKAINDDPELNRIPVVSVAAPLTREEGPISSFSNIINVLEKPVTPSAFFKAVVRSLGVKKLGLAVGEKPLPRSRPVTPGRFEGRKILVVEDNPLNRELIAELLLDAGAAVDSAGDGGEACRAVKRLKYDAVIMDLEMPGMDGLEASRNIRLDNGLAGLPIIAMTAHALEEDRRICLDAGMNDYLTKPIDEELLFTTLEKWIDVHTTPSAPALAKEPEEAVPFGDLNISLPGFDLNDAHRRLKGKKSLFLSLLNGFYHEYKNGLNELAGAIADREMKKAGRLAHTLKGMASNISASRLQEAASRLHDSIKDRNEGRMETGMKEVEKAFGLTLESARKMVEGSN